MRTWLAGEIMNEITSELEYCCVCGDPTNRAGKGGDSIYCKYCKSGPFCVECIEDADGKCPVCLSPIRGW